MSNPQIEFACPVAWPVRKPRTSAAARKNALWRIEGRRLRWDDAVRRLQEQVRAITKPSQNWRVLEQTLSTNFELRMDGRPRRDRGAPSDPAVAFFFELDGEPHTLACDLWDTVPDNIAAIAAHIEALRGQERWGVSDMKQAFAGHIQLPAPEQWHNILEVRPDASDKEIDQAYRIKMRAAHPDRDSGSKAAAQRLNWAREEGKRR